MDLKSARKYHQDLLDEFSQVPRTGAKDLKLWNKHRVISRINKVFADFVVGEMEKLNEKSAQPPPHSDKDDPGRVPEVFIPEWEPQIEQPENSESEYD